MKFKLPLILIALLASTAEAQITGTYLSNKPTLTSGIFSTTNTFIYVERGGVDVRKVTAPDILDFAGLGPTDVVTHGGAILNGNLTVTGTASSTGLDVINGNVTMTLGANAGGSTRGNNTTKAIRVGVAHYANASNPMAFAYALSESGTNSILWGGGTSLLNAVNLHTWYTTTTTTGGAGTERMRLTSSGFLGIGTTSPTTALDLGAGTLTTTGGIVSGTASLATLTNSGTITTGTLLATTSISSNILRSSAAGLGAVGFSHPNYIGDTTYYGIKQDSSARTTLNAATGASGGIILSYDNGVNGTNEVMRAIAGGVVFNEGSADRDLRIEGDTNANLFTLDAGLDRIGIGTATPIATLDLSGSFASSIRATAASGNITATDNVVTGTGAITLTLPTAVSITGREYILKNIGGVTMTAGSAGGTIDAATTQAIISGAGSASSMKFKSDGTNWLIID
jgi:hypothetical protein